jgi:putative nucleotidyltransferase with HDIG domain
VRFPRPLRRATARLRYRARQFFRGFHARLSPVEIAVVRSLLSAPELRLFLALDPRDRRHSYDVLRWLEVTAGSRKPSGSLLKAALLHDVGKGRLGVWDRVAFVLLEHVSTRFVDILGSAKGEPEGARWRHALWRLRHHAELGARVLSEVGTDPRVIELVARHTGRDAGSDAELAQLIEADRAS